MRQKVGSSQISLLYKARIGEVDHTIEALLRYKFVNKNDNTLFPADCVHIFAKNKPVGEYNRESINQIDSPLVCAKATEKVPPELKLSQNQLESTN